MGNSSIKSMTPLFYDGSFNRDGRRMRAVYERTVSDGTDSYRLWRSAGKPDKAHSTFSDDKYYLYVEVNGCLAPMGLTDYGLVNQCGFEAVDERYGGSEARKRHFYELRTAGGVDAFFAALYEERAEIERLGCDPARQAAYIRKCLDGCVKTYLEAKENGGKTFPDFIGALVLDDLARCAELSAAYQAMQQEERQARAARRAEEEKAYCEQRNRIARRMVADAIRIIRNGGVLENDTVTFFHSGHKTSTYFIILYLMRQYHIDIPIQTKGWIIDKLSSVTIKDGRCTKVQYFSSKRGRCSKKIFTCMDKLIRAVMEQPPEDGKEIP